MLSEADKPARPPLPAPIGGSGLWKQKSPWEREPFWMDQRDQNGETTYFVTNAQELAMVPVGYIRPTRKLILGSELYRNSCILACPLPRLPPCAS